MTLNLPPPVIFTHKETLHAIELPPLATFLSTLSIPDHLLKLNDILHRYRTPKSYHRVDVREVSSSELPLSSPEPEDAGPSMRRRREEEEKGEPVILEEGDTIEEYKARREAGPSNVGDAEDAPAQNGHLSPNLITEDDGPNAPNDEISTPMHPIPMDTRLTSTDPHQNGRPSKSPTPPTTVRPAKRASTPPSHTLPPSGPKRRVRELRLDLRTLDAAALFALETWRRELMGLEKLGMEHPDSIWYKDTTPTPTPSPSPEPQTVKRKRVRPPRDSSGQSQSRTPAVEVEAEVEEDEEYGGSGADIVSGAGRQKRATPEKLQEESRSPTPAAGVEEGENNVPGVSVEADGDESTGLISEVAVVPNEDLPMANKEVDTKEATQETESGHENIQDVEAFDTLVDGPVNEEPGLSPAKATGNVDQLEAELHNKSPTPPASPDIILMDGFNGKDDVSDFSPGRTPSPIQKRTRPSKNTAQSAFRAVPPPAVMGPSLFKAAPPPVPMTSTNHAGPSVKSRSSSGKTATDRREPSHATPRPPEAPTPPTSDASAFWLHDASPPVQLGSSGRTRHAENRENVLSSATSRASPIRPLDLSPTRPPIPLPRQMQEGGTSDAPSIIPDSPEKRDKRLAFVPFVREEMRIPTFSRAPIVPVRGLHWHEPEKQSSGKGTKRKQKEMEVYESRPKARRRSSIAKVQFVEEVSEEEEEIEIEQSTRPKRGQGSRRAGDSDDDEWADFRF